MQNLPIRIFRTIQELGNYVAQKVLEGYREQDRFVLGLPWGNSPIPFFNAFSDLIREERIELSGMHIVVMDEFVVQSNGYSLVPESVLYSGRSLLRRDFLVKLPKSAHGPKIYFPTPQNPENFDEFIKADLGGIDLFIVAAGADGHVAMRGASTPLNSRTEIVEIPESVREYDFQKDAELYSNDKNNVPRYGISVGLSTILDANRLLFMGYGNEKSRMVEVLYNTKRFDKSFPVTFLWEAVKKTEICVDRETTQLLKM